jgi:hypothetical protein
VTNEQRQPVEQNSEEAAPDEGTAELPVDDEQSERAEK